MSDKIAGVETAAKRVLTRAVELDASRRFDESVVCYQEGIHLLMEVLKGTSDQTKKNAVRKRIEEYMGRAEQIKVHVQEAKEAGKSHEQIQIDEYSTGHGYESLFGRYLDGFLTEVHIEDPYIRSTHQVYNLLRFCEMLVKSESPVTKVRLYTGRDESEDSRKQQHNRLDQITRSLQKHNVQLVVEYNDALHDREIRFNNGWILKIGRGLDIFKATESKFTIGFCDFDLRPCHKTTIDIFHSNYLHKTDTV
ncbi:MIT domain-containing protein 1-like [Mizuhopecten yessoensis]|uniref:MIT domain-containing protein 1 n=1 Tax=Mizuhopecten yessoensis TaxID=6573 RepID=A0A210PGI3_MIZYE|nr:MIT domain-containing protein 1-like [Mizuhopecten yessoensis]OWF35581.1 MIT domain-containing protein 1 [Mizuhopecten yessoensis]